MSSTKDEKPKSGLFKCFLEKDLFAYKAFLFFLYGGFGALYPYLPLYFKSYGLNSFQTGLIVGIRPLIQFFGAPIWAELGERFRGKKVILFGGLFAWIIKGLLLWAVIPKNQLCIKTSANKTSNVSSVYSTNLWGIRDSESTTPWKNIGTTKGEITERFVIKQFQHDTNIVQSVNDENKNQQQNILDDNNPYRLTSAVELMLDNNHSVEYTLIDTNEVWYLFLIFLMIIIIGEFLESPTYALSDASLLDRLGDDRNYYGQIRLWGAVGWALSTAGAGAVLYSTRSLMCAVLRFDYNVVYYVYFGFVSCAVICVYWFSFKKTEQEQKPSMRKAFKVLCKPIHVLFLLTILFSGCCFGFLFHFVNWYIDDKGGSTLVMGAAGAARELGEMTFFFLGGSCVRFLGHMSSMAICLLCYAACFYWLSIITVPWMAVPLEALDGAIYGLVWCNSISYMSSLGAPIGAVVIMQGILQGVFYGLGNGGGTVLSGHLYELLGPQTTFHYFAIGSLGVLLFLLISFPLFSHDCMTDKHYQPLSQKDESKKEDLQKGERP